MCCVDVERIVQMTDPWGMSRKEDMGDVKPEARSEKERDDK